MSYGAGISSPAAKRTNIHRAKQTWPFHTEASAARSTSEPQKTEPGVSRSVDFAPSPQYLDALVIPQTVVEELG